MALWHGYAPYGDGDTNIKAGVIRIARYWKLNKISTNIKILKTYNYAVNTPLKPL